VGEAVEEEIDVAELVRIVVGEELLVLRVRW